NRIERRSWRNAERWSGDMYANAQTPGIEPDHREGVVDLRGANLIQAESLDGRGRQIRRRRRYLVRRKRGTPRKELAQEALQVVIVRVGEQPAALEEARGCEPDDATGLFE